MTKSHGNQEQKSAFFFSFFVSLASNQHPPPPPKAAPPEHGDLSQLLHFSAATVVIPVYAAMISVIITAFITAIFGVSSQQNEAVKLPGFSVGSRLEGEL